MNYSEVLEKYITVVGVNGLDVISLKHRPLPKQVSSVTIEVSNPLFYHKGFSLFDIPIYCDDNFTRAEIGYWFPSVIRYLGISPDDILLWIRSKDFDFNGGGDILVDPVLSR